ncbi:MAG: Glucokinase [Deltaproteobacteria bacterium]|nr:Glucokinase [Deltaproteobacteria bacterium]
MILAGDVGGTKTNLALFSPAGSGLRRTTARSFRSYDYPSLEAILEVFLAGRGRIPLACIGVAGPVREGRSRLTNLSWSVDREAVRRACGARAAYLINDLQALAFSVPFLPPKKVATLQKGDPDPEGNIAVAAAGTGFGQSVLLRTGDGYLPMASEGGHVDFAPRDEREAALLFHLKEKHGRVGVERVVSGPGLLGVYRFLREAEGRPEAPEVETRMSSEDPPRVIVSAALAGRSATCREAVRFFCRLYGAAAGNLALQYAATGGVVLGGGLTPALHPVLGKGEFLEAFLDKGRFRGFLGKVPVKVILDDTAALVGAAWFARNMGRRR